MSELAAIGQIVLVESIQLLPWFAVAIALGVLIQAMALDEVAARAFRKHGALGVTLTTAVGAFSPLCSFTVIPVVRKFLVTGVPLSAVMAFWIASPTMDPEIFSLTAARLGMPLAVARLLGALALSLAGGFLVLALERRGFFRHVLRRGSRDAVEEAPACPDAARRLEAVAAAATSTSAACATSPTPAMAAVGDQRVATMPAVLTDPPSCGSAGAVEAALRLADADEAPTSEPWYRTAWRSVKGTSFRTLLHNAREDAVSLGGWLMLAIVLEALLLRYVSRDAIVGSLGAEGIVSVPLAAVLSVPLYLNGVGAIPIVGGLLDKGMTEGAAVAFLLGGAVTTVPALAAVRGVVNDRVLLLYVAIGLIGCTVIGVTAMMWL